MPTIQNDINITYTKEEILDILIRYTESDINLKRKFTKRKAYAHIGSKSSTYEDCMPTYDLESITVTLG